MSSPLSEGTVIAALDARPRSSQLTVVALGTALLCLLLAAAGGLLAAEMLEGGREAAAILRDASLAVKSPAAIGQDMPTSFGVVAVESMTKNAGPTAKALAGVTHGIQNLVPPNKLQVDATVTFTNLQDAVLPYSPKQFRLYATRGGEPGPADRPVRFSRSSVPAGRLQPNASLDATLTFIVPRDGSKLWMTFRDPKAANPILIDLGRTDRTPRGALDQYHAHQRGARAP